MQYPSTEEISSGVPTCRERSQCYSTSQDITFSGTVSTVPESIEAPAGVEKDGKHSRSKQRLSDMPKKKSQMR